MKRVSIKDIAKLAGVVPSTVSSVLNGKEKEARISVALAEKIKAIAKDLNYEPNYTAVSLRTGKTHIIGLIIEDIANPFFASLARALEDEAYKLKYRILFGSTENNDEKGKELLNMLFHRRVEGFIIAPSSGMKKIVQQFVQAKRPMVLIDRYFPDIAVPSTLVDNFMGVQQLMQHLLEKKYKRIGFVTVDLKQVQMQQREEAYKSELQHHGLRVSENLILRIGFNLNNEEKVQQISNFILKQKPDAIIFATNYLGLSGLESIKQLNISIPDDLAVVCFDDNDIFKLWTPGITSIAQPIQEIAKTAIELLFKQINEEEIGQNQMQVLKAPHLIVRSSA